MRLILFMLCVGGFSTVARGDTVYPDTRSTQQIQEDSKVQTQNLLNDTTERNKAISKDPRAKSADTAARNLVGNGKDLDDVYKLASEVFENIYKSTNGDPKKMKEAMEKFKKDPESFANSFTPEQKAKLHEIADKLNQPGGGKPTN